MSVVFDPRTRFDQLFDTNDVEGLIPDGYAAFRALVVDALRFFLSKLSQRRWDGIVVDPARCHAHAGAATRLVQLLHACPTLHKLGQVLARHRALDPAFRFQLQQLESFEPMTPLRDVRAVLDHDLGDAVGRYAIEFEPRPLAEASVALVTACTWSPGPSEPRRRAALKVLKPGVTERLTEELAIIADVADHLDERRAAYHLPGFAYRDTFDTVRDVLASEVQFEVEQRNLTLALRRYAHRGDVTIPSVLPFCTPRVTAMDRMDGVKFAQGDDLTASQRRSLARTVIDALLGDVIFSSEPEAVFHADPHAGNLLALPGGGLAILDWSLTGRLTKAQREHVAQIIFAAMRLDAAEVCRTIGSLAVASPDETAVRATVERAIDEVLQGSLPGPAWLTRLLDGLAIAGVRFPAELMLLRKTILILEGVVADLDGSLSLDAALITRALLEFGGEWPARWFSLPTSRQFGTHVSNVDVARTAAALPAAAMNCWLRSWNTWIGKA